MSLIQSGSREALQKNIETEITSGKDPKQAAAIAYSVQHANDMACIPEYQMDCLSVLQDNVPVNEIATKSKTYGGNNSGNFGEI